MSSDPAAPAAAEGRPAPLDLAELLRGRKLVVIGGTGFLGKVWWAHLLSRYPQVGRLFLVVRPRAGQDPESRFWKKIATSDVLRPLRDQYGPACDDFLREKVVPLAGDVVEPYCGVLPEVRDELRGEVHAVVNAAGVVDFDPPLDEALTVNAFGVQNLVNLARDLGEVPLMHTSTCFVAGCRTGNIEERDPREHPFPRAGELERAHWDPDREIAECLDVIQQARQRANDAFRQSFLLDQAKKNLKRRHEPTRGGVLETEFTRVKRSFVEARLAEMGMERAQFWGFPNTYTYTKAIGEQIVASSGLPFTIVRPAIIESTAAFPFPGWNEGINTSAPLIYMLREGQIHFPGSDNSLDMIPCDMVAGGMTLSLGELLEGRAVPVYQYGSSDTNRCTMRRFFELTGIYKRRYYRKTGRGGPIVSAIQSRLEGSMLSRQQFERYGPTTVAKGAKLASSLVRSAATGALSSLLEPAADALADFGEQQRRIGEVLDSFAPFTAEYDYIFRCDNTRAAYARLGEADRQRINWTPESIDWRQWFLEVHAPALEKWVFGQIEKRVKRGMKAPRSHETLTSMLEDMADRYELSIALQRTEAQGLTRISYRELWERAWACAARLRALGVAAEDRVLLAGSNHPAWAIDFFGIMLAGATAVPLDAAVEAPIAENLAKASRAKVFLAGEAVRGRVHERLGDRVCWLDLREAAEPGPKGEATAISSDQVAALIYTSGTTGTPKGVMLSHGNLTALVASLAPLFPLAKGDRVLSVLPLHHTFELTCGLLLPLSRGSRVVYLDELTSDRLEHGLKAGRITAMVGVPALWEMLERRIAARVAERGKLASSVFDLAVDLNRTLGASLGVDAGRLLFGPVHQALGGHLRYLVSGGAALPESTHQLFSGLGLHLAEGYGLTEAAPVLTVAQGGPKARPGHVGKPVPGVQVRIADPNAEGVGEVLARGPNVMLGYSDDPDSTSQTIDRKGWLHTGDLGKLDRRGNLIIVGRAKDTIVASNGENVYPDDVEVRLGRIDHITELAVLGISDARGRERVACAAVVDPDDTLDRGARHQRARRALDKAIAGLPPHMRPAVTTLFDVKLPRTATRKVKRAEVKRLVERAVAPTPTAVTDAGSTGLDGWTETVRAVAASIARREPSEITTGSSLRGDLGFDSLMLLELLVALEGHSGGALDAERLAGCDTVGEVESMLRRSTTARRLSRSTRSIEREAETPLTLPPPLRDAAMHWLGRAQMGFYDRVLRTEVSGQAYIPHNRQMLVAANHASHLDMGLIKYALGSYGRDLVSLAAQDYFFEGNEWRKAYFENLTNLVPLARSGSLRDSLRQAGELLDEGKTLLIFPEGTRGRDDQVRAFKPAVGHLALQHGVGVLPVWIGGTHAALPKGATVLRRRDVRARIGAPLPIEELRRLTRGLGSTEAARTVTQLLERAVRELAQGRVLDVTRLEPETSVPAPKRKPDLADVFRELSGRFRAGTVAQPVSFYFSLGNGERWTVKIDAESCEVLPGKVVNPADCVLKTSAAMFTRMVREAYTPSPAEFMSGMVKSNNISLLMTFQKAFQLSGDN